MALPSLRAVEILNDMTPRRSGIWYPARSLLWIFLLLTLPVRAAPATGTNGMVATVDPIATEAGIQAMKKGGNAVDAAVACALTLGVVNGYNSGIGGGCLMLIWMPNGKCVAIDGRETAPAAAARDMYLRQGKVDAKLSQNGALAAGVPGALAAYDYAIRQHGKLTLAEHLLAAARIAENGFRLGPDYAKAIKETAKTLKQVGTARGILLHVDGSIRRAGETLKQPELAKTYRAIAEHGLAWFYQGPFAQATEIWMREHGGILNARDFARYQVKSREPLVSSYHNYTIIGFPPPSSGGVHVLQLLNILEHFDLKSMGAGSTDFVHVIAESFKLAFADRAYWLGDSDFVAVPGGLVSKAYGAELAGKIKLDRATPVPAHGNPPPGWEAPKHTTHFSTVDASGCWVASTATINTTFGSKVIIPGTGVILNNEMDDFSAQPGTTNYFGLVGAEANAIAPGKRPLSSMSPTFVLRSGKPILAVGAAGGPTIISQTLLAIIGAIDFGMNVEAALSQPRFHHQWIPDVLKIEKKLGPKVLRELEKRGHPVKPVTSIGVAQAVSLSADGRVFEGAADPRAHGRAQGW